MDQLALPSSLTSRKPFSLDEIATELAGSRVGPLKSVTHLTADSRCAAPDSLFVALKGSQHDGHKFAGPWLAQGGAAVVEGDEPYVGSYIRVADSHRALSTLARLFAGPAAADIAVCGITGTNGKTTSNWLLYNLLRGLGVPTMRVGTLGIAINEQCGTPDSLTTPEPIMLWGALQRAGEMGVKHAVIEVSSHALVQKRVEDVSFSLGIFTNLTHDHLDYHKTFEQYLRAKCRLFDLVAKSSVPPHHAVINTDGAYGEDLVRHCRAIGLPVLTVGRRSGKGIVIDRFEQHADGSVLSLRGAVEGQVNSRFIGAHNAENIAGVVAAASLMGFNISEIARIFTDLPEVPGRLQRVGDKLPATFVDYAHTPDALERALESLRPLAREGRVWVVFGCGGDRDRAKRPLMAQIALAAADRVIVTSDNPRSEDAAAIIEEICAGNRVLHREVDRARAIAYAIERAERNDIVLIAGKGHEEYQIVGKEKRHFSDFAEAERRLKLR